MIVRYISTLTLALCLSLITGWWALEGSRNDWLLATGLGLFLAGWLVRGLLEKLSNDDDDDNP